MNSATLLEQDVQITQIMNGYVCVHKKHQTACHFREQCHPSGCSSLQGGTFFIESLEKLVSLLKETLRDEHHDANHHEGMNQYRMRVHLELVEDAA